MTFDTSHIRLHNEQVIVAVLDCLEHNDYVNRIGTGTGEISQTIRERLVALRARLHPATAPAASRRCDCVNCAALNSGAHDV
jgi:translation elongation factor EF-Tu-like GTPase